ncbi:MAG: CsbD family protein [Okeania sp. SIO2D1]|nr:CsbD family protein [Okeania sp. SIO2D1]
MSIEKRMEATAKNVEGKIQEMVGEVTGNPQDQAEGKVKQEEAKAEHIVENAKDQVKERVEKAN